MSRSIALLAAFAVGLAAMPMTARALSDTGTRLGLGLTKADSAAVVAAAQGLYQRDDIPVGAAAAWNNPKSRNHGTVKVLEVFTKDGMPCRKMQYDFFLYKRAGDRSYAETFCRTPEGAWKILP